MADLKSIIDSLKGISGSGDVLGQLVKLRGGSGKLTLEAGDYVGNGKAMAAPIATDLWYLFGHDNFMAHYFVEVIGDTYDFTTYMEENLSGLANLPGLKPLKMLRYLDDLVSSTTYRYGWAVGQEWANNGMFWINTLAFELWLTDIGMQFASDGPLDFEPNNYAGYITFPVGQLGVMEVISLIQETDIAGYKFDGEDVKEAIAPGFGEVPVMKTPAELFPGTEQAGNNVCYGKHLIESAYLVPDAVKRDIELFSSEMTAYAEDVKPKKWMRYWIHKESKLPVPGEFIGILCKPVVTPPHVWWFQESNPFIYAGNWLETGNLTSGVITKVTLEEDREDGEVGNQYDIKIEGCEVTLDASDFFLYKVGDRVAVLKLDSTATKADKSFTWIDQKETVFDSTDKGKVITNYIIIPLTFYKD